MKRLGKLFVGATVLASVWAGPAFAYDHNARDFHRERPTHAQVLHHPVARGPHFEHQRLVQKQRHDIRSVSYRHNPHTRAYHPF